MRVEQFLYHYLASAILSPVCKGKVLNIGLGPGYSARLLLQSRLVESVTTLEINQDVINEYEANFTLEDALEPAHSIVLGDALNSVPKGPFDWVYVDIFEDLNDSILKQLGALMNNLKQPGVLAPDGCVTLESGGDERIVKYLAERGWTHEVVRPALAPKAMGRAADMAVYRL